MTEEKQTNQNEELRNRVQSFNEELIPLLKNYNLGLYAVAFITPEGKVAARPELFDDVKAQEEEQAEEPKEEDEIKSA